MAAQLYACGQIKNNADVVMSDSTKKEKMNKVDFFIIPLQQEADRIGLGKEYAPVVKDATLLASARLEDLEARKSKAARHTKLAELLEISQEHVDADNKDGKDDDAGNSDSDSEKESESTSAKPLPAKSVSAETPLRSKSVSAGPLFQSTSAFAGMPFHSASVSAGTPCRSRPGQRETTTGRHDNNAHLLPPHVRAPYGSLYHQMPPNMYPFGTVGTADERHHFDPAAHQAMHVRGFNPATQPNLARAHHPAYTMHRSSGFNPDFLEYPHHGLANPYASSSSDSPTTRVSPSSSEASASVSKASHWLELPERRTFLRRDASSW